MTDDVLNAMRALRDCDLDYAAACAEAERVLEYIVSINATLAAVEAERGRLQQKLIQTLNDQTRLLDQERRRWYAALSFLGDLEGLAPEVVGDRLRDQLKLERRDDEGSGKCSCWLGRPGATHGLADERMACPVHRNTWFGSSGAIPACPQCRNWLGQIGGVGLFCVTCQTYISNPLYYRQVKGQ